MSNFFRPKQDVMNMPPFNSNTFRAFYKLKTKLRKIRSNLRSKRIRKRMVQTNRLA